MKNCYICKSENFTKKEGVVRDKPDLQVLQCKNCDLVFLSEIDHITNETYEKSGMHEETLTPIDEWLKDTEKDDQRRLDFLKDEIVNKSILDFGTGAAGFLLKAKDFAQNCEGIELEKRVHEYWGSNLMLHKNLDEVDKKYDLITAFHVFEHLKDPRLILKQLMSKLNDNGKIVIEVPNSDDALLTLYNSEFKNFTYWSKHLFLFNAHNLKVLGQQAGLKVISIMQYQRYPLSNHMYWLSEESPGGHKHWAFLDSPEISSAYAKSLGAIGKCDTIIAFFEQY